MPRLKSAVHVQHPTTRDWILLQPGDEPSPELAAEITNPDAWEESEAPPATPPTGEEEADKEPFGFAAPSPEEDTEGLEEAPAPPRRSRKASGTEDTDADA
ncbi:hypothetical protein ACFWXK_14320 [Streptomyces sp. NPDC059070]|uniref:hypothetical protein n=1 Tax=Streptomyces sp. NPDC059070 TaxID=3346713 RepID=UPI003689B4D7